MPAMVQALRTAVNCSTLSKRRHRQDSSPPLKRRMKGIIQPMKGTNQRSPKSTLLARAQMGVSKKAPQSGWYTSGG